MYNPYLPTGPDNRPDTDALYAGAPKQQAVSAYPAEPGDGYCQWQAQPVFTAPPTSPKKGRGRGAAAGLMAACMIFSLGCGFGGGYLANRLNGASPPGGASDEKPVIHQPVADNGNEGELSVADVVAKAADSVVEITAKSPGGAFGQGGSSSAGSGVILTADGYIVTNNHVVEGGSTFTVRTRDGKTYDATLIGGDSQTDLAVLKIDGSGLTAAVLGDSGKLVVGETAVAIGNPLGELGGSVTSGIISALSREITNREGVTMDLLQTNAAINPGNSGGGLFNSNGELIGIVNAKSVGPEIEGIGFAIPVNTAKDVIQSLIKNGHVAGRADAGFTPIDLTDQADALRYGVRQTGVYVLKVTTNTDGFRAGDLLYAIDGREIRSMADYNNALKGLAAGDRLEVVAVRGGRQVMLTLTLSQAGTKNGAMV